MKHVAHFTAGLAVTVALAVATPVFSQSRPAYMAPPAFTWTGFYLGVNAGGNFGNDSRSSLQSSNLSIPGQSFAERSNTSGFSGGGQLGYKYRSGIFVFGLEADLQSASIRKSASSTQSTFIPGVAGVAGVPGVAGVAAVAGSPLACQLAFGGFTIFDFTQPPGSPLNPLGPQATDAASCTAALAPFLIAPPPGVTATNTPAVAAVAAVAAVEAVAAVAEVPSVRTTTTQTLSGHLGWFGTARGRIGVLPMDNVLLYVTGGYAYGEASLRYGTTITTATTVAAGATTGVTTFSSNKNKLLSGYTIGVGAEVMLTDRWSLKGEYLYVDLGREKFGSQSVSFNTNVGRLGLNYLF